MVDTKKEQERDELHRAIWAIADELRGEIAKIIAEIEVPVSTQSDEIVNSRVHISIATDIDPEGGDME